MEPTHLIRLPDGRSLALDDVGDPGGVPVVYLHGTPDSRLARHPDDDIARACGVRLIAIDRPGSGDSDPGGGGLVELGDDIAHALDSLGVEEVALLGWSAGGLFALGAASPSSGLHPRVRAVLLVGTLPPVEAYADADLVAELGPRRRPFVELAAEVPPKELAAEVAPYLVPQPLAPDMALEHVLEGAGDEGRAELAMVPGAAEQMAVALMASVQQGLGGLQRDIELQLEPGLDLSGISAPVISVHGERDDVSPPAVGEWLAGRLPNADVEVLPDASHHLVFPHWEHLLARLTALWARRG